MGIDLCQGTAQANSKSSRNFLRTMIAKGKNVEEAQECNIYTYSVKPSIE